MDHKKLAWMKAKLLAGRTPLEIADDVYAKNGLPGERYRVLHAAEELEKHDNRPRD